MRIVTLKKCVSFIKALEHFSVTEKKKHNLSF